MIHRLALGVLVTLGLQLAPGCMSCGATEAPAAPPTEELRRLADVFESDSVEAALHDVDEAIADDRPVYAADLLGNAAIPALEANIARLDELSFADADARRRRSEAIRLTRARVRALEQLRAALSRGTGHEDEVLLEAMHADSEAQVAFARFHDELARALPGQVARPADLEGTGLPSLPEPSPTDEPLADRPEEPNPSAAMPMEHTP